MLSLDLMKYQGSQLLSVWWSAGRVSTRTTSFIHQWYHPVFQHGRMKLPGPTTCSGVRSWAVEDKFHSLQFLDIRGLHIPQSMAKANLILRSIGTTLERELPAPLGAVVWWWCKSSFWSFLSQKHQLKISGLYFGKTDELEHLFCLLVLPATRRKVELPWPMSSGCGSSR